MQIGLRCSIGDFRSQHGAKATGQVDHGSLSLPQGQGAGDLWFVRAHLDRQGLSIIIAMNIVWIYCGIVGSLLTSIVIFVVVLCCCVRFPGIREWFHRRQVPMGGVCSVVLSDGTSCTPAIVDLPIFFLGSVVAVILCSLTRKCCIAYCGFRTNIQVQLLPENARIHVSEL